MFKVKREQEKFGEALAILIVLKEWKTFNILQADNTF